MTAKTTKKKRTKKAPAVKSTCKSPGAIVREIAEKNPDLAFGEIVKMAVARGVNANTARGTLVRFKHGDRPAKRKTTKRKARKASR